VSDHCIDADICPECDECRDCRECSCGSSLAPTGTFRARFSDDDEVVASCARTALDAALEIAQRPWRWQLNRGERVLLLWDGAADESEVAPEEIEMFAVSYIRAPGGLVVNIRQQAPATSG